MDLGPTLLELAELEPFEGVEATSLAPGRVGVAGRISFYPSAKHRHQLESLAGELVVEISGLFGIAHDVVELLRVCYEQLLEGRQTLLYRGPVKLVERAQRWSGEGDITFGEACAPSGGSSSRSPIPTATAT